MKSFGTHQVLFSTKFKPIFSTENTSKSYTKFSAEYSTVPKFECRGRMVKDYYRDESFCRTDTGDISL